VLRARLGGHLAPGHHCPEEVVGVEVTVGEGAQRVLLHAAPDRAAR
jgi:hypothetical protein